MNSKQRFFSPLGWLLASFGAAFGQVEAQSAAPAWISEGPYVDQQAFSLELPMEWVGDKSYVSVKLGGKQRRFVFDTGSPSMISSKLAEELGLKAVDTRQGRDSHGAIVESQIVQAEITLGDVTFRKVPLFAADFSASLAMQCLVGDGVLGSELLPLCAWQIDKPRQMLRCNSQLELLDHIDDADRQRLYGFGYPHTPFLDIQLAEDARSKAMFDTGSPEYLALSPPDFEGTRRVDGITGTTQGFGSLGASLGGQAPETDQLRAGLTSFSLGPIGFGPINAHVREAPPSLIGAPILNHFVVTLDHRSESAFFSPYREGPFRRPSFGFSLGFGQAFTISLVWDNSPAAIAQLPVGQVVTSINGQAPEYSCRGIKDALKALSGEQITLEWQGGSARLRSR